MPITINQNPEQLARDKIDTMLCDAGWVVQSKKHVNLAAGKGVAVREYQTDAGPAEPDTLRSRLITTPKLDPTGLRPAQITAIENLEHSFKKNRPKALIQMATGAGKTFTAATFMYRLLKHADAKRILFVIDTKNLGEQAEQEFMSFQPNDDNRKFTELSRQLKLRKILHRYQPSRNP